MRSNRFVLSVALVIVFLIVGFPIGSLVLRQAPSPIPMNLDSFSIVLQTFAWAIAVGLCATAIGWPLGLCLGTLTPRMRRLVYTTLLFTLAIPSYAIYYAWWQTWPTGSTLHHYIVNYDLLPLATKCTLALALVSWSWPIAALISGMCVSGSDSIELLHRVDGVSLKTRVIHHLRLHFPLFTASCVLIAVITAANTTCFDLAQVHSIGNELRAITAMGGSIMESPMLALSSLFFAVIAAVVVLRIKSKNKPSLIDSQRKSAYPLLVVWVFLSGGPIILGGLYATNKESLLLFSQYGGDITRSLITATFTATGCLLILFVSAMLHSSISLYVRKFAKLFDYFWIGAALLPATIVAEALMIAWNQPYLDVVYRSSFLIVFGQLAQIGFIGSLAGRWVSSNQNIQLLFSCDAPRPILLFWSAIKNRVIAAGVVVVALSMAMSIGEVAMTTQLSQPATNQPIAVALLGAMHYQRPQIVTGILFFFVIFACVAGVVVAFGTRKCATLFLCCICIVGCDQIETSPSGRIRIPTTIIGGTGKVDGRL